MTQFKNGVNLGCAETCEQEITVLHRKWKNEKNEKIDLEKTDFLENAKFIPGLANDYFLLRKRWFLNCQFF